MTNILSVPKIIGKKPIGKEEALIKSTSISYTTRSSISESSCPGCRIKIGPIYLGDMERWQLA